MDIATIEISLLLAMVLYLGIKVKQQAIAIKEIKQKKEEFDSKFASQTLALYRSNEISKQETTRKEQLETIIERLPAVIYAKEVDSKKVSSGKLWLINKQFKKIFALSEEEVIGKTDREIFPPKIADAFLANDKIVINSKKPLTTEEKVYHANGKLHTYLSLKFPLFDENKEIVSIAGVSTDITEQKRIRTALKDSQIKFRHTFEKAAIGIAHLAPDGKWLRVNQKLCEIVGYSKEELLQKTFQEITYPEDLKPDLEYVSQMLAGEIESYSMEKRYFRKDGSLIWINLTVSLVRKSNQEPDYFISVIEDISEGKELKLSLQKSLKRLANLHQIDKAILETREAKTIAKIAIEDIQKLINTQRISIVTFEPEKETATILVARGLAERLAGSELKVDLNVWKNLIARLENSKENRDYAVTYLSKFSQLKAAFPSLTEPGLDCFISFPLKAEGKLLGILKIWLENIEIIASEELEIITEVCDQIAIGLYQASLSQKIQNYALELEAQVAERTAQLEDINQELNAFTYSISHDLKAPLRAIQGFATALQEDYGEKLDDLGLEYTSRLVSSVQQMDKLIGDLLAYSRLTRTQIQMRSLNLDEVVKTAIEQLGPELAQTSAQIKIDEPLSNMFANRTILIQVVVNLLSNAIKFVADGVKPKIHIWTEESENSVRLWVADNGIGIAPQHQERIFNVFERLHGSEAYPGTGIGLAIVKKGIERLGGKCGVESKLDRGSSFWIER